MDLPYESDGSHGNSHRRSEHHIRAQFFSEVLLLAGLGGGVGILAGMAVTAVFTMVQGWPFSVPFWVIAGGMTER